MEKKLKFTCEKTFHNLPFAHRQPEHDGHCRFIHGHNWSVKCVFAADELDGTGFVIDFGGPVMKTIRRFMVDYFDHTLVVNGNDPQLDLFRDMSMDDSEASIDLRIVDNCGAEGLAKFVLDKANYVVYQDFDMDRRGVRVTSVTMFEDDKNSATVTYES